MGAGTFFFTLPFPPAKLSPVVWTAERDEALRALHGTMPIPELAQCLGVTRCAVRGRVTRLKISKKDDAWSDEEIAKLRAAYASEIAEEINLDALAAAFGRLKSNVCRKARSLGLTNQRRRMKRETKPHFKIGREGSPELRKHMSAVRRAWFAENPHPRGMLGKRHSQAVKESIARHSAERWAVMSKDERSAHTMKGLKTKVARYGTLAPQVERGSWKAGWREIGDRRHFFRSRWEANYARYLQWLKRRGDILDWEYEPETFWFEAIKRGVRSYKPDFRVHELNGTKPFHEVKGWMDARSKTTLKRMAKYHPHETIILIREKEYRALSRFSALIGGWE